MKHRIIGSLVWLALAAIVLPFIMDGAGLDDIPKPTVQSLPVAPAALQPIAIEPVINNEEIIAVAPLTEPVKKSTTNTEVTAAKITNPVLDERGLPESWVVQLASFKKQANAQALRDKLIKAKYTAYMQQHKSNYRVLVGPVPKRTDADELQTKLKKDYKLSGIVVAYGVGE